MIVVSLMTNVMTGITYPKKYNLKKKIYIYKKNTNKDI